MPVRRFLSFMTFTSRTVRRLGHLMNRLIIVLLVGLLWGCSGDDSPKLGNNANNANNINNVNNVNNVNNSNNANNVNNSNNANNSNNSNNSNNMTDMGQDMADMGSDMAMVLRGTCVRDEDCPNGTCGRLPDIDGGFRTCVNKVEDPAPPCELDQLGNECCSSQTDCTAEPMGQCTFGPIFYCGGVAPRERNICVYGECTDESDCGRQLGGVCVPAGAFGEPASICVYGDCLTNGDCTNGTNGSCNPFYNPCNRRFVGFHCTYDESDCRSDQDCPPRGGLGTPYCSPGNDGMTTCESFIPPP